MIIIYVMMTYVVVVVVFILYIIYYYYIFSIHNDWLCITTPSINNHYQEGELRLLRVMVGKEEGNKGEGGFLTSLVRVIGAKPPDYGTTTVRDELRSIPHKINCIDDH